MQNFEAGTQYGDWRGTAKADNSDHETFETFLEENGLLNTSNELLVGIGFNGWDKAEGTSAVCDVDAYIYEGYTDGDALRKYLASNSEPIPVRHVSVEIAFEQFFRLFKMFRIVLTSRGFDLEKREFSAREVEE